ncbi:hypothetical protein AVEN_99025-1 [Araneus ventricosus]|uniref:Uncharacterized protein n=1 Tax=Araneus ventricosus TaxID=182803 RepID=A0A4Y2KVZ5_ARAVE|nr:hypothetical protein AVEN_99025-1 [Araneus ventricosus]
MFENPQSAIDYSQSPMEHPQTEIEHLRPQSITLKLKSNISDRNRLPSNCNGTHLQTAIEYPQTTVEHPRTAVEYPREKKTDLWQETANPRPEWTKFPTTNS